MKISMILKLNFLILGLGLTLYFIHHVNKYGLSPEMKAVFGFNSAAETETNRFEWSWCPTRVTGLILPEKFKVAQVGSKWVFEDGAKKNLNFIAVEKWLASSCAVDAVTLPNVSRAGFAPAMIIKYVDGKVAILRRNTGGLFMWQDQVFRSPDFENAMALLEQLPEERPNAGAAK